VQVRLIAKEQQRPVGLSRLSQKVRQLLHEVRAAQRTGLAQQLLGLLPRIAQRFGQAADGLAPWSHAARGSEQREEREGMSSVLLRWDGRAWSQPVRIVNHRRLEALWRSGDELWAVNERREIHPYKTPPALHTAGHGTRDNLVGKSGDLGWSALRAGEISALWVPR
jgi:hypothetical protein